MAYLDDIVAARDSLVSELKTETAYRATNGPKPTYSANGRNVSWNEWLSTMTKAIKELNDLIADGDPEDDTDQIYEHHSRGYT